MAKNRAAFSNRDRAVWFLVLLLGLAIVLGSSGPARAACGGSPFVTTDRPDYGPTEIVVISGTGFNCGEAFSVLVTAPDGSTRSGDGTGADGPDTVVTDDNGAFALAITCRARRLTAACTKDNAGSTEWTCASTPARYWPKLASVMVPEASVVR